MRSSKLCPLFALLISVVGCGKKATNSGSSDENPRISNQDAASNIVVALDTAKGNTITYKITQSGPYTLPEFLKIKSGSLPGRKVTVTFDMNPSDPSDYAIQCDYVTSNDEPSLMEVETCYDIDGVDIGNYTTESLPMHAKKVVKMELQGGSAVAKILAYFTAQ